MQKGRWRTIFTLVFSVFLILEGIVVIAFSIKTHISTWFLIASQTYCLSCGTIILWRIILPRLMERRLKRFKSLANEISALHEKLREQVDEEWKELEPKITEGRALMEKHDEIVAQHKKLDPAIDLITENIENISKEYQNKLLEKAKIEKTIEEYTKLNQAESAQIDVLKKDLAENRNRTNHLQAEQNNLKQQLFQVQNDYEQLHKEYRITDKTFVELKKKKEEIVTRNESLKSKIENLTEIIAREPNPEQLNDEINSLQGRCAESESKKSQLLARAEPLRIEHTKLNEAVALLGNKDANLKEEIKTLEYEQRTIAKKLKDENEQLTVLRQDNEAKGSKLAKLLGEKNKIVAEKTQLVKNIKDSEEELGMWQKEKEELKAKYHSYKSIIENNQKELDEPRIKKLISQTMEALTRLEG